MSLQAKICGLKKKIEVETAIKYEAAFCGFILNWPKSHRHISFAEAKSLIEENSGKILSNVSKKLDYLVVGEKPTTKKVKQAKELSIKVISQSEWEQILN